MSSQRIQNFFTNKKIIFAIWLLVGLLSAITKLHHINNFLIFRASFWHALDQLPLYKEYPQEYGDLFLYGPLFTVLVAPFAVFPPMVGVIIWTTFLAMILYVTIKKLPLEDTGTLFILWFCAHELLTALFMQQYNVAIAAIIIGTFILVEKQKDIWATLLIVIGTMTKLYGVVGLAFFFFSKNKKIFVVSLIGWSLVGFVLPMLISSPEYVISQYQAWLVDLTTKNTKNATEIMQNISLIGMVHRVSGLAFSDLFIIMPGLVLFVLPYFRFRQYANIGFRYAFLASVLMFTVLFSTGSESSTYIIAICGCAIWYISVPWKRGKWSIALLVFIFLITSMSPSDLFPKYIRETLIHPYALKALPVAVCWFVLVFEMMTRNYEAERK